MRFFAGYDISSVELDSSDLISQAYEKGVPMGSDINYDNDREPHFLVWAVKGKHGAPLQRIQIIKGWIEKASGTPHEKVYDVACSDGLDVDPITNRCPDNGARVNINNCSISSNVGATELKSINVATDNYTGKITYIPNRQFDQIERLRQKIFWLWQIKNFRCYFDCR